MTEKNGFTKSGGSPPTKRKLSWQYDDLAGKIQLAPRQFAASRLLCFLGKAANDGGTSHHGYASLMSNTGIRSRHSVADAIKYLLTVGIEEVKQPILTRTKGGMGKETSHYKLHLGAMQKLVQHQGIFDIETGKLARYKQSECVPVSGDTGVPVTDRGVPVTDTGCTREGYRGVPVSDTQTLIEPSNNPHEGNPKKNPLSKARATSESSSSFDEDDLAAAEAEMAARQSASPNGNGSPKNSSDGDLKSSKQFTLKRWCPICNEPAKLGGENADLGGIECAHCGGDNIGLTAPMSDAKGKRWMEQLLDGSSEDDRHWHYSHASVSQRRWIAMGKFADEMAQVLAANGESK